MEEILVSIICNTYNHENYISDSIESFLMQKTKFKFEVLIHDDASTDKTAEIIRSYEEKYPNIIKPIYQEENQYSKGRDVFGINYKRARGEYIAFCEGDDYWIDPYKLQKQVEFLEQNPDFSACVHASVMINAENKKIISKIQPSKQNSELYMEDIIEGGGGLVSTNSIVYRKNRTNIRPDFFYKNKFSFLDYQLMILLLMLGKVYYLNEFMSVYRVNVPGSWTLRNASDSKESIMRLYEIISMLDMVNKETEYVYDKIIQKTKCYNEFNILILQGRLKEAKNGKYKNSYQELKLKSKVSVNLKCYAPKLHRFLLIVKNKIG